MTIDMQDSHPLAQVTPLLLTYNEEANIARTLEPLRWARRIVVIDSGSTDRTLELIAAHRQVDVFHRPFDTFANQCNFGLSHIPSGWILSLDADYLISPALKQEIAEAINLAATQETDGFRIPFRYCIQGQPLRSTILPPRIALFRIHTGIYEDDGHAHKLILNGKCADLQQPILHDDRKPLSRWLWAQNR